MSGPVSIGETLRVDEREFHQYEEQYRDALERVLRNARHVVFRGMQDKGPLCMATWVTEVAAPIGWLRQLERLDLDGPNAMDFLKAIVPYVPSCRTVCMTLHHGRLSFCSSPERLLALLPIVCTHIRIHIHRSQNEHLWPRDPKVPSLTDNAVVFAVLNYARLEFLELGGRTAEMMQNDHISAILMHPRLQALSVQDAQPTMVARLARLMTCVRQSTVSRLQHLLLAGDDLPSFRPLAPCVHRVARATPQLLTLSVQGFEDDKDVPECIDRRRQYLYAWQRVCVILACERAHQAYRTLATSIVSLLQHVILPLCGPPLLHDAHRYRVSRAQFLAPALPIDYLASLPRIIDTRFARALIGRTPRKRR